jgi:glycine cleavage system H lipoate-binding protein
MRNEKIINDDPMKCVWMTAGVVGFKLCGLQFDCEHCAFDRAIRGMAAQEETFSTVQPDHSECSVEQGYRLDTASFYDDTHLWLRIEDEGRVRIGIDDFAQRLTGRIYSIRLPEPGEVVAGERQCWSITHAYGETFLGSGLEGTVFQKNEKLLQMPSLMNLDPYGEGWAFVLEPHQLLESLKPLLYGKRVRQWYANETHRLRSLLDVTAGPVVTMQDGGLPAADASAGINKEIINMFLSCEGKESRR